MREYLTPALVLSVRSVGEHDRIADLFTKNLGRIRARVPGGRKLLSKFSPHLQELSFVTARLVEKHALTVTDVQEDERFAVLRANTRRFGAALNLLPLLRELLPLYEADIRLWHYLRRSFENGVVSVSSILAMTGYDPRDARCASCGARGVRRFVLSDNIFLCEKCSVQAPQNRVLLVN